MDRFSNAQLERFLEAVDGALDVEVTITVIGGSGLALAYGVRAHTNDIDTYQSKLELLDAAVRQARTATGLDIPIANAVVAQLPPGFESRARRVLPNLSRLRVLVADAIDLATRGDLAEPRWALVHLVEEVWGDLASAPLRRRFGMPVR
jgi:hypothetical protein